jgi:hypothetical protein
MEMLIKSSSQLFKMADSFVCFFALVILEIGSCFMPRLAWTVILIFMLPHVAGMTGMQNHTQPLIEMGWRELHPLSPMPSWA